MVKNLFIKAKEDSLVKRRRELSLRKQQNQAIIVGCGFTMNQRNNKSGKNLDPEKLSIQREAINDNIRIDKELGEIKKELSELYKEKETDKNMALINLFKEIFEPEQLHELYRECNRRIAGETPFKISFDWKNLSDYKESSQKYKKRLIEQLDKMVEFRIELTKLIEKGCDEFGKEAFLKFISPLNRLIIPIKELEMIKRKIIDNRA